MIVSSLLTFALLIYVRIKNATNSGAFKNTKVVQIPLLEIISITCLFYIKIGI